MYEYANYNHHNGPKIVLECFFRNAICWSFFSSSFIYSIIERSSLLTVKPLTKQLNLGIVGIRAVTREKQMQTQRGTDNTNAAHKR
jgi:hypothetical protein